MQLAKEGGYTVEDIYALAEGQRAELFDGRIYYMAPPSRIHQKVLNAVNNSIYNYIKEKGGPCEVYPAPFAVFLNIDDKNYVEPDISVICDKDKLDGRGCSGAPDWVIEIVSPSTKHVDYGIKLFKYRNAGVREYWIVNPMAETVNVFDFGRDKGDLFRFSDKIPVCIYDDLSICIKELMI